MNDQFESKETMKDVRSGAPENKTEGKTRNRNISLVAEASGWTYEYAEKKMKDAKAKGIPFKEYRRNEFWNVPETDQEEEYKHILTRRANRENFYEEMSKESDMSVEELKKLYKEAKEKYQLTLLDFKSSRFWGVPAEDQEAKSQEIHEQKARDNEILEIEEKAREKRKKLILADHFGLHAKEKEGQYPDPIRFACACLNKPLPRNASMDKRLETYIGKIDCSLEALREILGEELLPDTPAIRKEYKKFHERFSIFDPLSYSDTDMAVFFTDWLLFCGDYGFNNSDYLEYRFYEKTIKERNEFMGQGYRGHVRTVCNTNLGLFKNKPMFNEYFKSILRRDWMQVTDFNYDEFCEFVKKHERFFAKPIRGGGGVGAGILSVKDQSIDELYEYCSKHECIIEEVLKQHRKMASVNDGVANTVRLYTLVKYNGSVTITGAFVKFSRPGLFADNLMQGGIGALVDKKTGIIISDGVGFDCKMYEEHPDSHVKFKGFQIPEWEKLVNTAIEGAKLAKKWNRHVGWDIAIREDGEIEIIEGNSYPDLSLLQVADRVGKKEAYEKHINKLAKAYNVPDYPEIPENIQTVHSGLQARAVRKKLEKIISE